MEKQAEFQPEPAVAAIIRQLLGGSACVERVEHWGGGALNICYKVVTSRPSGMFFVKFENNNIVPTTRGEQIAREVNGIRLASAAGIRVPDVLAYDLSGVETGRKYLVETFLDTELFWEIRDALTPAEREALNGDAAALLEQFNGITCPLFGDLYPEGAIGQHACWGDAYRAWGDVLLADSRSLSLFNPQEEALVVDALARGAAVPRSSRPAGFYHGDLGLHNIMVDRSSGMARLGTVIDFGNASFAPLYANEDGARAHGGFGLAPLDAQAKFGVQPEEQKADGLLFWFEQVLFFAALKQRHNWDPGFPFREQFLEDCRNL